MIDTVGQMFLRVGRRFGDDLAVEGGGATRSYRELAGNGTRLANALAAMGVSSGDRVALMMGDQVEAVEAYAGCAIGGFPIVHVNAKLAADEVRHIISNSGAQVLLHTDDVSEAVESATIGQDVSVVTIGKERPVGSVSFDELLDAASSSLPDTHAESEDIAILAYTSGTTGRPKGALISHRAIMGCVRLATFIYRLPARSRCCYSGSMSFVGSIWGQLLPHLYIGGSIRLMGSYDIDSWFNAMTEQRTNYTFLPSPHMLGFAEAIRRHPVPASTLTSVMHAGSTAPKEWVLEVVGAIGDRYFDCFGMTEVTGALTVTSAADIRGESKADDIYASVGRAVPTARIAVVDDEGLEMEPGDARFGELVADVDTLFSGYWGQPEATTLAVRNGRYFTGDIGRMDAAGYVYVTDRKADLIVSGGANVYPAEVERVLVQMSGVAEAAVVGIPHERWGEAVVAAIVLEPGAMVNEEMIVDYTRRHLASYKKPTRVLFLESLPRNASLKVTKDRLRERFANARAD